MSITALTAVTVYVPDQDEALVFYRDILGLEVRDDISFPNGFRWLSVAAPGQDVVIMLEDIAYSDRAQSLPQAVGGNSTWVLSVDDCRAFTEQLRAAGVNVTSDPTDQPYGIESVIEDPYGNSYALVQRA
jgi:predicted enzyme related to lactoylglutathione lyase